jgi:uncharacterized membrane protein YciS (DUF1049 family)
MGHDLHLVLFWFPRCALVGGNYPFSVLEYRLKLLLVRLFFSGYAEEVFCVGEFLFDVACKLSQHLFRQAKGISLASQVSVHHKPLKEFIVVIETPSVEDGAICQRA